MQSQKTTIKRSQSKSIFTRSNRHISTVKVPKPIRTKQSQLQQHHHKFLTHTSIHPMSTTLNPTSSDQQQQQQLPPKTHISTQLLEVRKQLQNACTKYNRPESSVQLLAVSKTHPTSAILEAYALGQRHFGENYVNELVEKAPLLPTDIAWHFIGTLQSNKAKFIAAIPNITLVESIDSEKLALKLNNELIKVQRPTKLDILVQINTSDEEQKGGIEPHDCVSFVQFIQNQCPQLNFKGLMTIGKKLDINNPTAAPYFKTLTDCRDRICEQFPNIDSKTFMLSMGMTDDYEDAIQYGSTQIRVGTAIFGARSYPTKNVDNTTTTEATTESNVTH